LGWDVNGGVGGVLAFGEVGSDVGLSRDDGGVVLGVGDPVSDIKVKRDDVGAISASRNLGSDVDFSARSSDSMWSVVDWWSGSRENLLDLDGRNPGL
jgi:hypothetical protein